MAGRKQNFSTTTTRQKVTAGIFILIVLVLLWQVYKMFGGVGRRTAPPPVTAANKPVVTPANQAMTTAGSAATTPTSPGQQTPQQAQLIKTEAPQTPQEVQSLQMQRETQARYLTAVSELQMLRVARDIAETNQAIMTARLSAVTSQKKIVDMLSPPPPPPAPPPTPPSQLMPISPSTAATAVQPKPPMLTAPPAQGQAQEEVKYSVVSVALLQYRWSAVIAGNGVLYNVRVGDVLPLDNSKVIRIDNSGVVLQRKGVRRRISLVPII